MPKLKVGLFYLLAALLLIGVWHMPIAAFLLRRIGVRLPDAPRSVHTFAALAYGPVGGPEGIPLERVEDHLTQLQMAGYVPIRLQDVHDLLYAGKPVPERAVLLTFDRPRARSWRALAHVIRLQGWQAAAFVPAERTRSRLDATPGWGLLRLARGERRWEIGALGHADRIPVADDGRTGPFFTASQWLTHVERGESLYEYQARIHADQRSAREILADRVRAVPLAFAYAGGSFGQDREEPAIRNLIRLGTTARHFELGFITGHLAYNGWGSDPLRLNRLRVDPGWSGATLLAHLNTLQEALPLQRDQQGRRIPSHWIMDRTGMALVDGHWHLSDRAALPPARLWVSGSPSVQDLEVEMALQPGYGTLHWWWRTTPDDQYGLHLQWHHDGRISLQSVTAGAARVLATADQPRDGSGVEQLHFHLRGPYFQMEREGLPVFVQPVRVPDKGPPGYSGIGIGRGDSDTPARARLDGLRFRPMPDRVAVWEDDRSAAKAIHAWHRQAHCHAVISPPARALMAERDPEGIVRMAYRQLAHWSQALLAPVTHITGGATLLQRTPPQAWAARMATLEGDGVYIRINNHTETPLSDLQSWLEQVWAHLDSAGKQMLLHVAEAGRQPDHLPRLAAALPGVRWVATQAQIDAGLPLAGPVLAEAALPTATTEEILLYHELRPSPEQAERRAQRRQADVLAEAGHIAIRAGQYEQAIAHFSDWHALEPRNPAPLNAIADALQRLSFRDEAVDFLQQSLEIDPGQRGHLERVVTLLDELGRDEEARGLLNQYALLFPDNPDIQLVQAHWLTRQYRREEARTLLERSLRSRPDHLPTALLLLRLADRPDERLLALRTILREGARPEQQVPLVTAAREYDLLTRPDTGPLYDLLQRIAAETDQSGLREEIQALRPRTAPLEEDYADDRALSRAWQLEGGVATPAATGLQLRADIGQTTFQLRLGGAQNWQDQDVEVQLNPITGSFWLQARRAHHQMVRFGYDESTRRFHLQRWTMEDARRIIADERSVERSLGDQPLTLRLEVRGNGALAYVNGERLWPTPLPLPGTMRGGGVALEGHAAAPGQAQWELHSVTAGPRPAGLAWLRGAETPLDEAHIKRLQQVRQVLTDLSPDWFRRTAEGAWHSLPAEDQSLIRTFAHYHGLRLMPMVTLATLDQVTAGELRSLIHLHDLDGLVLRLPHLPDQDHLTRFARQSEAQGLHLIFVEPGAAAGEPGQLFGIGPARALNREQDQSALLERIAWHEISAPLHRLTAHTLITDGDKPPEREPTEQDDHAEPVAGASPDALEEDQ